MGERKKRKKRRKAVGEKWKDTNEKGSTGMNKGEDKDRSEDEDQITRN